MAKKTATDPTAPKSAIEAFAASVPDNAVPAEIETNSTSSAATDLATTETPEVIAPESSAAPVETAPPDFLERVRSAGFADVADENSARDRLFEAYQQQRADLEARERRLQEVEPFVRYGQEHLDSLRAGQAKPREEVESKSWWDPPQVDPALVRKYQVSDPTTGDLKWSAETPAHVRAEFEKYQAHIDKWSNDLIYRPREALKAPIQEFVAEYLQQALGMPISELPQRLDLNGEQRAYQELVSQHGERLYVKDPITNRLDPDRLTPFGETVEKALERAEQMKIPTAKDRLEYAMAIAEARHPAAAKTTEKRAEVRKDVLRRAGATGLPQRNGSTVEGRPQNKQLSPGHQMLQKLDGIVAS